MGLVATTETSPAGVPRVKLDLTWDAPPQAAVAGDIRNALSAQASGFEDSGLGVGGWAFANGTGARSTTFAATGAASVAFTVSGTGGLIYGSSPTVSVTEGQTLQMSVAVRSSVAGRNAAMSVEFPSAGLFLGSTITVAPATSVSSTGWTYLTGTVVVPIGAVSARMLVFYSNSVAVGNVLYIDNAALCPVPPGVSITRTAAGQTTTIRNGNPAAMTGGTSLTAFDYEAPFDVSATFTATDPATGYSFTSGSVTPTSGGVPWLVHPGLPELSEPLAVLEWPTLTRPASAGVFQPIGRRNAVVVSSVRQSERGTLVAYTSSLAGRDGLIALLEDGAPLLIKGTSSEGWGYRWVAVGEVTETPVDDGPGVQVGTFTVWALPLVVVDEPSGLVGNVVSYASSTAASASYAASLAKAPTYANRSAGFLLT